MQFWSRKKEIVFSCKNQIYLQLRIFLFFFITNNYQKLVYLLTKETTVSVKSLSEMKYEAWSVKETENQDKYHIIFYSVTSINHCQIMQKCENIINCVDNKF